MVVSDVIAGIALLVSGISAWYSRAALKDAQAVRREAGEAAKAADAIANDRRLRVEAVKHDDLLAELFISFQADDRSRTLEVQLDPITPGARFIRVRADGKPHTAGGLYESLFISLHAPAPEVTFVGRCFMQSPVIDGETEIEARVFSGPDPERAFLISRRAIIAHARL